MSTLAEMIKELEHNQNIFGGLDGFVFYVARKYITDEQRRNELEEAFVERFAEFAEAYDAPTMQTNDTIADIDLYSGDPEDAKEMRSARKSALRSILLLYPQIMEAARRLEPHGEIIGKRVAHHYREYAEKLREVWNYCVHAESDGQLRQLENCVIEFRVEPRELDAALRDVYQYVQTVSTHADEYFNAELVAFYNELYAMRELQTEENKKPWLYQRYVDVRYAEALADAADKIGRIVESVSGTQYLTPEIENAYQLVVAASGQSSQCAKKVRTLARSIFPDSEWPLIGRFPK